MLQTLNCHCSTLEATDHMETNGQDHFNKALFKKSVHGPDLTWGAVVCPPLDD